MSDNIQWPIDVFTQRVERNTDGAVVFSPSLRHVRNDSNGYNDRLDTECYPHLTLKWHGGVSVVEEHGVRVPGLPVKPLEPLSFHAFVLSSYFKESSWFIETLYEVSFDGGETMVFLQLCAQGRPSAYYVCPPEKIPRGLTDVAAHTSCRSACADMVTGFMSVMLVAGNHVVNFPLVEVDRGNE